MTRHEPPPATHHHLACGPATTRWGYVDARAEPVMTVRSGDVVTIDAVSGAPEALPPAGFNGGNVHIPPELLAIHAAQQGIPFGPHILTGPVAIEGAEPGDALQVDILDVKLRQDWGFNLNRPLAGTLPTTSRPRT